MGQNNGNAKPEQNDVKRLQADQNGNHAGWCGHERRPEVRCPVCHYLIACCVC
jgi:hypothetical protein